MINNTLAQINFPELEEVTTPKLPGINISSIVSMLLPYIFVAAGLLLLFYLIMGGFSILTSGGNPKNIEAGKNKIAFALIGFLVVFAAYWIIQAVGVALGLDSVTNIFFGSSGPTCSGPPSILCNDPTPFVCCDPLTGVWSCSTTMCPF